MAIVVVVWAWPRGESASSDDSPPILTGTVPLDSRGPALRPIEQPETGVSDTASKAGSSTPLSPAGSKPEVSRLIPPGTQPASSRPAVTSDPVRARSDLQTGLKAWQSGDLLTARTRLNQALHAGLSADEATRAREALGDVARRTIFTRAAIRDDPLVDHYLVRQGDTLNKIAKQFKVSEDLLAEINGLADKHFIRQGARLKVVRGPFHAAIGKSDHLVHVYLQNVLVGTYRVALGVNGSTPTGRWKVVNHQQNPSWTDPRTGKRWHANDPENPIGEYWIGLEGVDGDATGQFGYGIHGTIEPETIGHDVSMGCVRLTPADIARLYKLLVPGASFVSVTD